MKPSTIRGIHSILSGTFAAAGAGKWTDRNPAESAKPPTTSRRPIPATSPEDVANPAPLTLRRVLPALIWDHSRISIR